jgi:tetratricopeptide (TPR) repeat protein
MLDLEPPIPTGQKGFAMAKLAGVKSYLGLLPEARTLLGNAEEFNREQAQAATIGPDEALRNVLAIAEEIARFDGPQAALASMERQSATTKTVTDQQLLDQKEELVKSLTAATEAAANRERRHITVTIGERPNLSRQQREALERESQDPDDWHLLGQLALTSGDFESARRLLTRAAAAFSEQQKSIDLARTLADLGSLAGMQGNWYESVESYQRALEIEEGLGKPERQIHVLSQLASAYVQLKDDSAALKAALRVLELTENRPASPHTLVALYVCVLANGTARLHEAWTAMERFVETFPQVEGAQSLAHIQKQFQESLRRIRSVKVRSDSRSSGMGIAFSNQIEEAQRLQQIGALRQALDVLAKLESEDRTYGERAWIYRMRGNAFQTAGQHGEAVPHYTEASRLFRQAGLPDEEIITDIQRSVSLRGSGKADEAEAELRRLLLSLPPGLVRFQALLTLANTLTQSLPQSTNASDLLTEARMLYDEARAIPGLSAEHLGLVESNAANLDAWEGKFEEALRKLRLAHKHLLRCNSRYLPSCELAIRNAEKHHSEDTKS